MTNRADKIIVALDVPSQRQALALVEQLREQISFFKVGLQLYSSAGPEVVREIVGTGARVFVDLKLHDIPNTVARAVESINELGVDMLTLHLSGGSEMIRAAVSARRSDLCLLGVTVLTSATDDVLREIGISDSVENEVLRLARLGAQNGINGVVASPREITSIRSEFDRRLIIVTPGIRPAGAEPGDQKRFTTARQALEAGADHLVVGRPITADRDPREAILRLLRELNNEAT